MPRPRKDSWLENCFRCWNCIKTKYLEDGKDNGAVSYLCSSSGKEVKPWMIDGCKKYLKGEPQIIKEGEKHG